VRVVGQAPRARRIKTASEESPSRRRSQSSSTSRAARIGPHPHGADVCHLDHGGLPRPGPPPPSPGNHVSARPDNPAAIRISDNPHPAPIPARAHNSRPRITRAAPSPPRVTHPRLAESMGVALYRFLQVECRLHWFGRGPLAVCWADITTRHARPTRKPQSGRHLL